MTTAEAKAELKRLFIAFPSYRQWIEACDEPSETLTAWCQMLSSCELDDVRTVVDDMLTGDREPTTRWEKPDRLPRNIREEAKAIRSRRTSHKRQHEKYHADLSHLRNGDRKFGLGWREAMFLGAEQKAGRITKSRNDDQMAIVLDWMRSDTAPEPVWLHRQGQA